jgi:xylulokinase
MYVTIAFNFTGGSLLRWYRDTFGGEEKEEAERMRLDVYDIILSKAEKEPTNIFLLPHFTTTGTPYFDSFSKGVILGLTLDTTKSQIIKSIIEGISYEIKLNIKLLEQSGVKINKIHAIGGGAKNRDLLQLKADMFGKQIISLKVSEAACLGASILGGVATGIYSSI